MKRILLPLLVIMLLVTGSINAMAGVWTNGVYYCSTPYYTCAISPEADWVYQLCPQDQQVFVLQREFTDYGHTLTDPEELPVSNFDYFPNSFSFVAQRDSDSYHLMVSDNYNFWGSYIGSTMTETYRGSNGDYRPQVEFVCEKHEWGL